MIDGPTKPDPDEKPLDWLPPLPIVTQSRRRDTFLRQTLSRLRPIHLFLGSVLTAILTTALILGAIGYVAYRTGWLARLIALKPAGPAVTGPAVAGSTPASPLVAPRAAEPAGSAGRSEPSSGAKSGKGKPDTDKPHHQHGTTGKAPSIVNLTKEEIVASVKQNTQSLGICIVAAKNQNKVPPGPAVLLIDFNILPDGSVNSAQLKGPDWALKTVLPQCFNAKILTWHFPTSTVGAPVTNMPLPVSF